MSPVVAVGTKGTCLLCLSSSNAENGSDNIITSLSSNSCETILNPTATAFKMLLRYLKVDMMKVARDSANPLKCSWNGVHLCEECSSVANDFLELFQAFEGIRLQLDLCVRQLYEFMEKGCKDPSRVREFQERMQTGSMDKIGGSNNVSECLRKETMAKAFLKVGYTLPRVSLESLPENVEETSLINGDENSLHENSPSAFKCPSCEKLLPSDQGLKVHYARRHSSLPSQKSFICDHCGRSFAIQQHLRTHLILVHPVANYANQIPYGVSDREFNKAVTRMLSKSIQLGKQCGSRLIKFVCPNCGERMQHFTEMRLHLASNHLEKVIESVENAKACFDIKSGEKQKPTIFNPPKVDYSVPRTSLRFQIKKFKNRQRILSKSFLVQDQNEEQTPQESLPSRGSKHKCSFCRKILSSQHGLKLHYATKHLTSQKLKVWKCDHCEHSCTFERNLHAHMMLLHPAATFAGQIPAGISDQEFVNAVTRVVGKCTRTESLLRSRSGQMWKIKCPHCECGTTQMGSMKLHVMRYHLEEIIEATGKVKDFSVKLEGDEDLAVHFLEVEIGGTNYNTLPEVPDTSFPLGHLSTYNRNPKDNYGNEQSVNLENNVAIPFDNSPGELGSNTCSRPWQCVYCELRFTQSGSLQTHQLYKHPKAFLSDKGLLPSNISEQQLKSALTTIIAQVKSQSPAQCPFCGKETQWRHQLKPHFLRFHLPQILEQAAKVVLPVANEGNSFQELQPTESSTSNAVFGIRRHYQEPLMGLEPIKRLKCQHCERCFTQYHTLHAHRVFYHPVATFAENSSLPPEITDQDFDAAVRRIVGKSRTVTKNWRERRPSAQNRWIECPCCEQRFNQMKLLRLHIPRSHLDKVIEATGKINGRLVDDGAEDNVLVGEVAICNDE